MVKLTHTVVSHQFYKRPVGSDLSFQPGTVSLSSTEGPGPVRVHKERLLTHSRSGGDQIGFANTYLPQSTVTGSPPKARLKWIQQYTTTMQRKEGGRRGAGHKRRAGAVSREEVTLL